MLNSEILTAAFKVAATAHKKQKRKGTDTPYIAHPMGVASLVIEQGGSDHVVAAALLHDVLEDTDYPAKFIGDQFGSRVLELVLAVTNPGIEWKKLRSNEEVQTVLTEYRLKYFEHIKAADADTQLLSAADKLHNARAILEDLRSAVGLEAITEVWDRFRGKRAGTSWYYDQLADVYLGSPHSNVRRLGKALKSVVAEMLSKY